MKTLYLKQITLIVIFFAISISLLSCGGGGGRVLPEKNMPEWVTSLPKVANTFFAVGRVNIGINSVLALNKVDAAARSEVGKYASSRLKSVVENVIKENIDLIDSDNSTSTEASLLITNASSDVVLGGIEIVDRWEDTENNTLYALAKIKLDDLKTAISSAIDSNPKNVIIPEKKETAKQKMLSELEKFDINKGK